MLKNKKLLAAGVIVISCMTIIWFSTTTHGKPETYELQPWISVPQYKTDTVRAIEAYERLMERYINTTERNSIRTNRDLKEIIKKLDSINDKLTNLSLRISTIEKTLGIENPMLPENTKPEPKYPENNVPKEFLPIW